ncbi:MAG: tetratricopeptide repeat protein [Bryobacterales bacterium]|nr:tetratricopeptide repeat protein [Bryobacterales bacterium]
MAGVIAALGLAAPPGPITVDYPVEGSVFPPEITPPTFLWRDGDQSAALWRVEIAFAGGFAPIRKTAKGDRLRIGQIDPRCIAQTNELPKLTPEQAAARTWTPDPETWELIKKQSAAAPATITITGFQDSSLRQMVSRGQVTIRTSRDPVGAPIFYRDVPLMPSELEKGVIKPLAPAAVPLIAWRLRNVGESGSRLLLEGLPTCANCHSFSSNGKTLGLDLDGPQNDKGLYAIVPIRAQTSIRRQDVVAWSSFRGKLWDSLRVGFMSQVSPDGRYVVTTINGPEGSARRGPGNYYVANFKDYRFLQVFYPTRGILAWYSRSTGRLQPLQGAEDPAYVHTNAVWSPDGQYLVFARAQARDPYPESQKMAEYANDPNETQIRYDLCRIPFNGGRGGQAELIAGASQNGMSNSFPKVSPDGRWIVYVQSRNGQLMRPDSQLHIVPFEGGRARRMRCNTPLMNSWHSFSPNGRWLVFSSKSRSPYTQMFLTHLDEDGNDSPAILIENATAANRAVNIPEFVNIPPDGLLKIEVPAVEFYRRSQRAWDLAEQRRHDEAIIEWKRALELDPEDAKARTNLGLALARAGKLGEALEQYRRVLASDPGYSMAHNNLGVALAARGQFDEAIAHYRKALESDPGLAEAHTNLGVALASKGQLESAIAHFRKALETRPGSGEVRNNLAVALARAGRLGEAIPHFRMFLESNPNSAEAHNNLAAALAGKGMAEAAVAHYRRALDIDPSFTEAHYNLGDTLYYLQGKVPEALEHWRKVLAAKPDHLPVLKQTAWALATSRDASLRNGAEAITLAERALRLPGGNEPVLLGTLGAAYAEAGRFDDAVEVTRRAAALARESNDTAFAETLSGRITLYRAGTPLRADSPSPASSVAQPGR